MPKEDKQLVFFIPEKEQLDFIRKMDDWGMVLQIAMTARNLDAKTFAEKIKVTPASIYSFINNTRKPSPRLLRDMLECLKLTPWQFIYLINYYNNYKGEWKYTYTLYETVKIVVENLNNYQEVTTMANSDVNYVKVWASDQGGYLVEKTPELEREVKKIQQLWRESDELKGYCPHAREAKLYEYNSPGYEISTCAEHYGVTVVILWKIEDKKEINNK